MTRNENSVKMWRFIFSTTAQFSIITNDPVLSDHGLCKTSNSLENDFRPVQIHSPAIARYSSGLPQDYHRPQGGGPCCKMQRLFCDSVTKSEDVHELKMFPPGWLLLGFPLHWAENIMWWLFQTSWEGHSNSPKSSLRNFLTLTSSEWTSINSTIMQIFQNQWEVCCAHVCGLQSAVLTDNALDLVIHWEGQQGFRQLSEEGLEDDGRNMDVTVPLKAHRLPCGGKNVLKR